MQAVYDKLGRPLLSRRDKTDLGNGSVLSGSGLAIGRVLEHAPEVAPRLLNEEARATLRAALGPQVDTEVVAGVISDHNRSLHPWHHHIGGPDEDIVDPELACAEPVLRRLSLLIYLDELRPGSGQLMILPRRLSDPVAQPFDDLRSDWDGQVLLTCPVGTAVLMDERTWHGATRRTVPGLRMFVGGQFVSSPALRASRADPAVPCFHEQLLG